MCTSICAYTVLSPQWPNLFYAHLSQEEVWVAARDVINVIHCVLIAYRALSVYNVMRCNCETDREGGREGGRERVTFSRIWSK